MKNKKFMLAVIMQAALAIIEAVTLFFRVGLETGFPVYSFYTEDSNFFALAVAVIFVIFGLISLKKNATIPKWVAVLRYMSVVCLTITFFVVVLILTPMFALANRDAGIIGTLGVMLGGLMFFEHFLCPLLSFLSLILLENDTRLSKKDNLLAMIPTFIYAAIFITLNILKLFEGPYPFLMVYRQPWFMSVIYFIVIMSMALLIAFLIRLCVNRRKNKQ